MFCNYYGNPVSLKFTFMFAINFKFFLRKHIINKHKKGQRSMVNINHPISIILLIGKIFEFILKKGLTRFLNSQNAISNLQFSFRTGKPTLTPI